MSNRMFQSIVQQIKDSVDRVIGVVDSEGMILACSDLNRIGEPFSDIKEELFQAGEAFFARKFDEDIDNNIICLLSNWLRQSDC